MITMKDLYNREAKILSIKQKFKDLCPECFNVVEKFEHTLKLNNYSTGRIEKYWSFLKTIHSMIGCFEKARKENIEDFVIKVDNNEEWSDWTKYDFKRIIKIFYRWLSNKSLEGEYPEIVKWIKPKIKKNNSKPPEQVLTKEEIELLANNTKNIRDKALVLTLYESGCRIGELLNMKIKDVAFDQLGCYILVSGKTGWRRVRIIEYSKALLEWLDFHPFKNNPESYVWISLEKPSPEKRIKPNAVNSLLKDLAKKCNITKPIHPHAFRHARATHLAKHLPEAIMKEHFGWTRDSKMASVYYHLSGKDVDEALLKMHGIKVEEVKGEKVGIRVCQRCGENNSILSHFCKKCGSPLDLKIMLEVDEERRKLNEFLRDFLVYYAEKDKNFKKIFTQFVKERNAESLFRID
ncbi:MAG: site-specific integrase [Candidatus Aenigmatarchaeota archaeon]